MNNSYIMKSPVGLLKICEENDKITGLFKVKGFEESSFNCKNKHFSDLLFEAYNQINQYFSGKRKVFDLPIHYKGTSFQYRVWQELQSIPYGETRSYKDIAIRIGNPDAFRAVGQANSKNPIMLIIPCHRVISMSGNISGYAWGNDIKKYLLDLE